MQNLVSITLSRFSFLVVSSAKSSIIVELLRLAENKSNANAMSTSVFCGLQRGLKICTLIVFTDLHLSVRWNWNSIHCTQWKHLPFSLLAKNLTNEVLKLDPQIILGFLNLQMILESLWSCTPCQAGGRSKGLKSPRMI